MNDSFNRRQPREPAARRCASVAAAAILWSIALLAIPVSARAESQDSAGSLIGMQLYNDMMYGTDDLFGENSDLSYADRVRPSEPEEDQGSQTTVGGTSPSDQNQNTPPAEPPPGEPPPGDDDGGGDEGGGDEEEPPPPPGGG